MSSHEVQIHSDGTPRGTHIITDSGVEVDHVTHVDIEMDAREFTSATLTILKPIIQITAEVREVVWECRICGGQVLHDCHNPDDDTVIPRLRDIAVPLNLGAEVTFVDPTTNKLKILKIGEIVSTANGKLNVVLTGP